MPLVEGRAVLRPAFEMGYAVGSFNAQSFDFIYAIIEAATAERSPVIISLAESHFCFFDPEVVAPAVRWLAERAPVPLVLNLDHGTSVETAVRAIRAGFTAVMFDGSQLPYDENTRETREVVRVAHAAGVSVEAELGRVGGSEDDTGLGVAHAEWFTDPAQAEDFVGATGVDFLAVAIGNAHGLYKGEPKLDFERLAEIKRKVQIPLVLHGGSGISDDDFRRAASLGISKINFFTEVSRNRTARIRELLAADPEAIHIGPMLLDARATIREIYVHQMRVFGSAGRAGRRVTLWEILASAFVIGFSGAVVPGPLFTAAVAEAAAVGWIAGPLVSLGHGLAELAVAALLGAGVSAVKSPTATKFIAIGGGLVLIWMGAATCWHRPARTIVPAAEANQRRRSHLGAVGSGLVATLANPFWYLWWMTVGAAHITLSLPLGSAGVGAFYVGHVASDIAWYSLVAALVALGRRTFSEQVYQALIVAAGLVMAGFGVAFIAYGVLRSGAPV